MRMPRKLRRMRPTRSISCALACLISYGALLVSCGGGSFQPRQLIALSVQPSDAVASAPDGTVPFSATGTFDSAPTTQANVAAQWSSSDQSVATLDPNTGIATCVAAGGPIGITATAAGKSGMLHSSATLILYGFTAAADWALCREWHRLDRCVLDQQLFKCG